ncbi:MAG: inositol monophosphatase family protein [Patescibacteria group bacterium]|nr:inositol monophosphatase family protein [Patescibacteria group bacterium]
MNNNRARQVIQTAVRRAGRLLLKNFNKVQRVELKTRKDLVLAIDVQLEKMILRDLRRHFPEYNTLSEQQGFSDHGSAYTWVLDPMDGSVNYFNGVLPVCVGVALVYRNTIILSAVYEPLEKRFYFAERGQGAWLNGRQIKVSRHTDIHNTLVMTHLSSRRIARALTLKTFGRLYDHDMRIRMNGSGIAALAYVAAGKFDVFYNILTYPWDIIPGALLVQEAGGKVTDFQGRPITLKSTSVLGTNRRFHSTLLRLVKDAHVPSEVIHKAVFRSIHGEQGLRKTA